MLGLTVGLSLDLLLPRGGGLGASILALLLLLPLFRHNFEILFILWLEESIDRLRFHLSRLQVLERQETVERGLEIAVFLFERRVDLALLQTGKHEGQLLVLILLARIVEGDDARDVGVIVALTAGEAGAAAGRGTQRTAVVLGLARLAAALGTARAVRRGVLLARPEAVWVEPRGLLDLGVLRQGRQDGADGVQGLSVF